MIRLKSLKIHRHPLLAPDTELCFGERVNLLIGLNGTGKTTLLELIDMALRQDFSQLAAQPFKLEYQLESDTYSLTVKVENRQQGTASKQPNDAHPPEEFTTRQLSSSDNSWYPTWQYELRWKDETLPHPRITVKADRTVEVSLQETPASLAAREELASTSTSDMDSRGPFDLLSEEGQVSVYRYKNKRLGTSRT